MCGKASNAVWLKMPNVYFAARGNTELFFASKNSSGTKITSRSDRIQSSGTSVLPVPVAARSKARMDLNRSKNRIVGSNSDREMDVYQRFSALCHPV
jgi:hypothetical protein